MTQLRNLSYRPLRLRPFTVNGETLVASIWTRDAIDWRIVLGVDASAIARGDESFRPRGFRPVDVASWRADEDKFVAIWAADTNASEPHELMIDVAGQDFDVLASSVRARGFMP